MMRLLASHRALGALPSPLWGGVGGGGPSADHRTTPTPALRADPPHKGEGRTEYAARVDSSWACALRGCGLCVRGPRPLREDGGALAHDAGGRDEHDRDAEAD